MTSRLQWDIQLVCGTAVDENGFLVAQPDAYGEQGAPAFEVHHPGGLWHCPDDPEIDPATGLPQAGKSAEMLTAIEGSLGHAWLLHDPRIVPGLPLGVKGETVVYGTSGTFHRHRADGSILDVTTSAGGDPSGQTIAQEVTPTGHRRYGPWGREVFDQTAYRVVHAGGARFSLGYAGGILPGLSSYCRLQAHMVELNGSAITIGPTGSPGMGVAKAQPLVAILQLLLAATEALSAGVAGSVMTGGQAAAAAAAPAIAAAQVALASAVATIATQTAIG